MKFISISRALVATFVFATVAFLFSCKKEASVTHAGNTITEEEAATYSDESAQVDGSFDDISDIGMTAADADNTATFGRTDRDYHPDFADVRASIGLCATITISPNDNTYPKTITIDFGDGCVGLDGKLRSGKIILNLTAPLRKPGSVLSITLDDFYINKIHIEGTKTITNLSENGTIKFSAEVTGGKVTFPNGRGYSYECSKLKEQIAGMATAACLDDVFQITGSAKIEYNNGVVVTFNVVDPLIKKILCPWRSDGTLAITVKDHEFKLDYGFPHNGDCDRKALLTWNDGNSQHVVVLP
jgi:hypothetical protein